MIKNKDGSYNKVSIIILSLIALIGLGIIASTVISEPIVIGDNIIFILLIVGLGLPVLFIGYKITHKKKSQTTQPVEQTIISQKNTVIETIKPEQNEVILEKIDRMKNDTLPLKQKPSFNFGGLVPLIISTIILSVILLVLLPIMNSVIIEATPKLPDGSPWANNMENVQSNLSSTLNFIALGLPLLGVVIMITAMYGIFRY